MSAKNKNKVVEQKIVPTQEVKPIEVKEEVKMDSLAQPTEESETYVDLPKETKELKKEAKPKEESLHHKVKDINGRMVYETNAQYMEAEKSKGNI